MWLYTKSKRIWDRSTYYYTDGFRIILWIYLNLSVHLSICPPCILFFNIWVHWQAQSLVSRGARKHAESFVLTVVIQNYSGIKQLSLIRHRFPHKEWHSYSDDICPTLWATPFAMCRLFLGNLLSQKLIWEILALLSWPRDDSSSLNSSKFSTKKQ